MIWDKENSDYLEEGIPLIPPFCCIGLDYMFKSDSEIARFLGEKSANGEVIERYNEHPIYLYQDAGDVGFYSEIIIDDVNKKIDSQNVTPVGKSDRAIWDALVSMRLKESGDDYSDRFIILKSKSDGKGIAVLQFLYPDIVPSRLENDEISLRVTAYPEMIRYYENEEEYESDISSERGDKRTYLISEGTIFPSSFLWNHDEENREGNDFSNDNVNLISGIVKDVLPGVLHVDEERDAHFLKCFIDTEFGELEIIHTEDEVPIEQRHNIHPGAFVFGAFQLVGNPAVGIFEHGLVRDEENNLRRLRQIMVAGLGSDLSAVLDPAVTMHFDDEEDPKLEGKDRLMDYLDTFYFDEPKERIADLVTISDAKVGSLYPVGKRAVAYQPKAGEEYDFIAFLETNASGNITKLVLNFDDSYWFLPDSEPEFDSENAFEYDTEQLSMQERLAVRAYLGDIVESMEDGCNLITQTKRRDVFEKGARKLIEHLENNYNVEEEKKLPNLFAYMFAKAAERSYNPSLSPFREGYDHAKAYTGSFDFDITDDDSSKMFIEKLIWARNFYKDFKYSYEELGCPKDEYLNLLEEALVEVSTFGEAYGEWLFNDMSERLSDVISVSFSPENDTRINGRHSDERIDLLFVLEGGTGYVSKRKLLNLLFEKKYMHKYMPRKMYREFKKLMEPYESSKTREYMDHDRYEELHSEIKAAGMKLIETLDEKSLQNFRAGGTCVKDEDIDRILAEREK